MKVYKYSDRTKSVSYPIVFEAETHKPDPLLLRFAIAKKERPRMISPRHKKCADKTIQDAIDAICWYINMLAEQEQEDGTIGVHYLAATYESNMQALINDMYYAGEWLGESIEIYVKYWRQFYRFLTLQGIEHHMYMPDTIEVTIHQDTDDNFLSHTEFSRDEHGEIETAVDASWKNRKDDYKDSIISMEQFWLLYAGLYEKDPVYAALAFTELSTCFRVDAAVNEFPLSPNRKNPDWLSYKEMVRHGLTSQKLKYISKQGNNLVPKQVLVPITCMDVIQQVYISPEAGISYQERKKLYRDVYMNTKWGEKSGRGKSDFPSWILQTGTPVSIRQYQTEISDVAKKNGFKASPHTLRHTGATQMLYRYLKNNGLLGEASTTNPAIVGDAHIILQGHLGHVRVATTKRYIRTIERFIQESQLDLLLNTALSTSKEHAELLESNQSLKSGILALEKALEDANNHVYLKKV